MKTSATELKTHWIEHWPVVFLLICAISFPLFFDIYRKVAFNTAPRDDYAPFLLLLISHHGHWPESPFGYRILSVAPAIPLFWVLPLYKFSLLANTNLLYLRATEALSALSFLATATAATFAFKMVRGKLGRSLGEASLAALLTIVLASFDGVEGVDPVGICLVYVLLYCFEQSAVFCPLFLLAPFTNEKVIFFFVFLIAGRLIFVQGFYRSHARQIAAVVAGLAIYVLALKVVALPGNEGQVSFARRLPLLLLVGQASLSSLKGVVRNILPALVIVMPCAMFTLRKLKANPLMTRADLVVPLGMTLVGLTFTDSTHFQVGRIVSYAMPLTVIGVLILIGDLDQKDAGRQLALAALPGAHGKSRSLNASPPQPGLEARGRRQSLAKTQL